MIRQKVLVWVYRLVLGGGPEYLLLRRPPSQGSVWQPVTGKALEGEDLYDAACRELAEETGIGAGGATFRAGGERRMRGDLQELGSSYGFICDRGRRNVETVFERCAPEDAPLVLSSEHVHGRWFSYEQAQALLPWDGQVSSLAVLHDRLSELYAGVDLAGPSGPSVALLDSRGELVTWATLSQDELLPRWLPVTTALCGLNAPLSLPFGMGRCCLEEPATCACQPVGGVRGRLADRLLARQGIARLMDVGRNAYRKPWMRRSLGLAGTLRRRLSLVEVCSLAARNRLFTEARGHRVPRSRLELQRAVDRLVPGLPAPSEELLSPWELDAVVAAHVAWLHARGATTWVGDPAEGAIAMP